jgi:hypothetical protein
LKELLVKLWEATSTCPPVWPVLEMTHFQWFAPRKLVTSTCSPLLIRLWVAV